MTPVQDVIDAQDALGETLIKLRSVAKQLSGELSTYHSTFAKVQVGRVRSRVREAIAITLDAYGILEKSRNEDVV